jgi:hypothetical protein
VVDKPEAYYLLSLFLMMTPKRQRNNKKMMTCQDSQEAVSTIGLIKDSLPKEGVSIVHDLNFSMW